MGSDAAIPAYLSIVLLFLFPVVVVIVLYYAEPGFPWHSYITLVAGFYAAFAILLLVPIDIAIVERDRFSTDIGSDPQYSYDIHTLSTAYDTFFTMVLILGSFVLVFEEYYNTDGYFSFGGKISSSLKRMFIDVAGPGVVGCIILGILIGQHVVAADADALKLTAVILTNTVYELGLMFLLGYALIEYPRSLWTMSNLEKYLLNVQIRASSQFKDISDAQLNVSFVVADVLKTKSSLASTADLSIVQALDILAAECPSEFRSERMGKVASNKQGQVTVDSLAELRTRLNYLKDVYRMSQAKVEGTKILAYRLEDIVTAKNNPNTDVIHWSLTDKDSTPQDYKWQIVYKPILLKVASVLTGILSFLSFLGVVCSMKGVSNNVSPYFLAVHSSASTPASICIFIFLTFGYTIYITTWSIFQMKISAACELVPGRTTPEALSFNVRMVARLAAPLAFFYLGWISENGIRSGSWTDNDAPSIIQLQNVSYYNTTTNSTIYQMMNESVSQSISMPSAFSNFYQLQSVGSVQEVFGTIFPIVLFIVLALFALNIFNRLLVLLNLKDYQFGDPIVTDEQLREGKRQLQRHKKNTERKYRRGGLKNFILNVNQDDDSTTLFGKLFSFCSRKKQPNPRENIIAQAEKVVVKEPELLYGTIEKKAQASFGNQWKETYAEVRSPGFLHFYKDKRTADSNRVNTITGSSISSSVSVHDVLDLRLVMDFKVHDRKNKENVGLDLELADETIRLKFKSLNEVDQWKKGLQEWKEFNLDYGSIYPNGMQNKDIEQNSFPAANNPMNNVTKNDNLLDNIQVEEEDDDDKGVRPLMKGKKTSSGRYASEIQKPQSGNAGSSSGGFFGRKAQPNPSTANTTAASGRSKIQSEEKPQRLEGWLEKKGRGGVVGNDWQKRYVRIDESNATVIYSKSSDPKQAPSGTIDLKFVKDITPYEKSGKPDYSRFNVDVGEKVYKFKAVNETEGQKWIDGLNAWKDYFLMNMMV